MNFLDWLQTTTGMVVSTLGTLGIGALVTNTVAFFKNIKSNSKLKTVEMQLGESAKANKELAEQNKEIIEMSQENELEKQKNEILIFEMQETIKLLLEGMTYIISAAGGIDDVTKVAFIKSASESKEAIVAKIKEVKEMSKEKVVEKTEELLERTTEKAEELLQTARTQAQNVLDKYSKR